jgi:hypothetical protein
MAKGSIFRIIVLVCCVFVCRSDSKPFCVECDAHNVTEPTGNLIQNFLYDTGVLHYELMSSESLKLLALFAPVYIATRHIDDSVHSCFYCPETHKNLRKMDSTACTVFVDAPLFICGGLAALVFNPWDKELALSARVFASALVPLWLVKNFFKEVRHEGCLRPRCEFFKQHKRYYGGCPSGHMSYMAYATTFWGLHYGWKCGVPLGLFSIGVFAASVNCNRHFVSQLIAGTGLGIAYGIAANKVISCYESNSYACDVVVDNGKPALQLTYSY